MKFRITKENIVFDTDDADIVHLAHSISKVLVPKEMQKLYFFAHEGVEYVELNNFSLLQIVSPTNINESVMSKTRLVHNIRQGRHQLILVLANSNNIDRNKWSGLCKLIQTKFIDR